MYSHNIQQNSAPQPRIILEKLRAAELPVARVVVVDLRTAEPVMACALAGRGGKRRGNRHGFAVKMRYKW